MKKNFSLLLYLPGPDNYFHKIKASHIQKHAPAEALLKKILLQQIG